MGIRGEKFVSGERRGWGRGAGRGVLIGLGVVFGGGGLKRSATSASARVTARAMLHAHFPQNTIRKIANRRKGV